MELERYGRLIDSLGERYYLERSLGSGGMADVCLAWDEQEERAVAIKVIKQDQLDQRTLDRFMREAARIASWRHPNILRIYSDFQLELLDAELGSVIPYIVMEYAEGGDLQRRLRPGQPWPLPDCLRVFEQLCSAVAYAHRRGVIHRDLKPLNILFRPLPDGSEQVVLSDFGLAISTEASHITFARGGTPHYMAPEQFRGVVLPACDIFALGVILYQLCTGRRPFQRTVSDLLPDADYVPPTPPSSLNPQLPPALDAVLLCALAEDPDERFASADLFWQAVRAACT
ncbi:MAG: serine/threonine protein kinase, partial [Ktedonobacteraceae bacterium]|nr:serine/threonine protein kinase [Ktedonobacteraceae bacterium]